MKTLILFRHAKSDWPPGVADRDRPLGPRGRLAAGAMADWLLERALVPERVLCSAALRTRQTLALALDRWAGDEAAHPAPEALYRPDLYLASPERMLQVLAEEGGDAERVMMVGHNPGIHLLAAGLARPGSDPARQELEQRFPTAAMAVLAFDLAEWSDASTRTMAGRGDLVAYQLPRELD